jgi:hypothetical protein
MDPSVGRGPPGLGIGGDRARGFQTYRRRRSKLGPIATDKRALWYVGTGCVVGKIGNILYLFNSFIHSYDNSWSSTTVRTREKGPLHVPGPLTAERFQLDRHKNALQARSTVVRALDTDPPLPGFDGPFNANTGSGFRVFHSSPFRGQRLPRLRRQVVFAGREGDVVLRHVVLHRACRVQRPWLAVQCYTGC